MRLPRLLRVALLSPLALLLAAAEESEPLHGFSLEGLEVPRELVVPAAPRRDPIASLDAPGFVGAEDADWVAATNPVIGVALGGQARAYPIHLLEYHPLLNDELGGVPVVVGFDPFTATGRAYRRELSGRVLEFGLAGLAYNAGLLLYDRETQSLWSLFEGRAIAGPLAGKRLTPLPVRQEHMGTWLVRHPGTRVLERPQPERIDYRYSPFKAYWLEEKIPHPVRARDESFHPKEVVLGVEVGDKARAYLGSRLAASGLRLEDEIDGKKIRIDYDPDEAVFIWEVPDGVAVTDAYWFAWKAFHPDTEIWKAPEAKPSAP
jgi:hypothetical protein